MQAMIIADLLTMKKQLLETTALFAVILLVTWLALFNSPVAILFVGPIQAIMMVQHLMIDVEKGSWESTRLALPLSRMHIVTGRYASLAIVATEATLFSTCLYLLVCALGFAFPVVGSIARMQTPFDGPTLALCAAGSVAFALIMLGAVLPFFMRLKTINAMRWSMFAAMLALMAGFQAIMASGVLAGGSLSAEASNPSVFLLSLGLAAMGGTFYVASATIAVRLYEKREL